MKCTVMEQLGKRLKEARAAKDAYTGMRVLALMDKWENGSVDCFSEESLLATIRQ